MGGEDAREPSSKKATPQTERERRRQAFHEQAKDSLGEHMDKTCCARPRDDPNGAVVCHRSYCKEHAIRHNAARVAMMLRKLSEKGSPKVEGMKPTTRWALTFWRTTTPTPAGRHDMPHAARDAGPSTPSASPVGAAPRGAKHGWTRRRAVPRQGGDEPGDMLKGLARLWASHTVHADKKDTQNVPRYDPIIERKRKARELHAKKKEDNAQGGKSRNQSPRRRGRSLSDPAPKVETPYPYLTGHHNEPQSMAPVMDRAHNVMQNSRNWTNNAAHFAGGLKRLGDRRGHRLLTKHMRNEEDRRHPVGQHMDTGSVREHTLRSHKAFEGTGFKQASAMAAFVIGSDGSVISKLADMGTRASEMVNRISEANKRVRQKTEEHRRLQEEGRRLQPLARTLWRAAQPGAQRHVQAFETPHPETGRRSWVQPRNPPDWHAKRIAGHGWGLACASEIHRLAAVDQAKMRWWMVERRAKCPTRPNGLLAARRADSAVDAGPEPAGAGPHAGQQDARVETSTAAGFGQRGRRAQPAAKRGRQGRAPHAILFVDESHGAHGLPTWWRMLETRSHHHGAAAGRGLL